jgi:hypothetical protein
VPPTEPHRRSNSDGPASNMAADPYADLGPYTQAFQGIASGGEWANSVSVTTVGMYDPTAEHPQEEADWAADFADRQLVRVDTNYKSTRPGAHPVDLSRPDAVRYAAAVLEAIEDTFHNARVGELRAAEAAELLTVLADVDAALSNLREHALFDLRKRIEKNPDA